MRIAAFVLGLVIARSSSAQQQPGHQQHYKDPHTFSDQGEAAQQPTPSAVTHSAAFAETIVSVLSASTQHATFLHLLQRSKSIPMLGHITNATVFAPTDDAWSAWGVRNTPSSYDNGDSARVSGWLGPRGLEEWLQDEETMLAERLISARPEDEERVRTEADNQAWALRQHILFHCLNYTISEASWVARDGIANVSTETTLLFPLAAMPDLPPTPEPGVPWLPRGGDGLLGGHGQRLRVAKAGSDAGGYRGRIGIDHAGEGGAAVWDGAGWPIGNDTNGNDTLKGGGGSGRSGSTAPVGVKWARNGLVVGLDDVLDPPGTINDVIHAHPSLSYLARLLDTTDPLPRPLPPSLTDAPHLTVFAASDAAFAEAFDDVERGYLEGGYGAEGLARVVAPGLVVTGPGGVNGASVGWSDAWGKKSIVDSASGVLSVRARANGSLVVNGTEAEVVDIFASNGVVHIMPNLLVPEDFTLLNSAEKILLSRNATRFVSLLRSANLSSTYIGEPGKETEKVASWTILAPTDDAIDFMDRWGGPLPAFWVDAEKAFNTGTAWIDSNIDSGTDTLGTIIRPQPPFEDVSPLAALLQYHIIPGRVSPNDIKDGMLLGTELRTSALNGARQRMRVDVSETRSTQPPRPDWRVSDGEIRFGGATVLDTPVKSGKSIVYLVSSLLAPPLDVMQTAVSDLQLSTFIAAVYAAGLDRSVKNNAGTTYFIPRNKAFGQLGLTMKYLLLPEAKDELRKVVRYHAIEKILYTPDMETGRTVYTTLEGGNIVLSRVKNGSVSLISPSKWDGYDSGESLPANGDLRPAHVTKSDSLTETGVIHTIDSVVLPADVTITVGKLVRGSRHKTMADLMVRAGLGWVLEGREPSSDEVTRVQLQGIVRAWDNDSIPHSGEDADEVAKLAMPSYAVLVPTDKAFSRMNLSRYLSDEESLLDLLKLHIIPQQQSSATLPPHDGSPLSLEDDLVYDTLLSSSSKYGQVAFRATGDNGFLVGVRNARSGSTTDAARVGAMGRASVHWKRPKVVIDAKEGKGDEEDEEDPGTLWRGGMTLGGGVVVIDSVLVPYKPTWLETWGWLVFTLSGAGALLLFAAGCVGWWWMTTKDKRRYEALEGEEEE